MACAHCMAGVVPGVSEVDDDLFAGPLVVPPAPDGNASVAGLVTLIAAGAALASSSLFVPGNSLRPRRFRSVVAAPTAGRARNGWRQR